MCFVGTRHSLLFQSSYPASQTQTKTIHGSTLSSLVAFLSPHKLSIWPPYGTGTVLIGGTLDDLSLNPAFRLMWPASFDCSWCVSSQWQMPSFTGKVLFIIFHSLATRQTLFGGGGLCAEYYLLHPDWLKLLMWLAGQIPLFWLAEAARVIGRTKPSVLMFTYKHDTTTQQKQQQQQWKLATTTHKRTN